MSLGFSFHFPGAFCNFVMRSPQNDMLKCQIVLNPPKLATELNLVHKNQSPAAQNLGCMVYYGAELRQIELNLLELQ